ncbi:S8 family serine peptidase [Nocardioidaceae bacterium SCSIO 66511]|nr:S8 family serine peptidase [Nocardioidaceae bacterium SCSIO 66511]
MSASRPRTRLGHRIGAILAAGTVVVTAMVAVTSPSSADQPIGGTAAGTPPSAGKAVTLVTGDRAIVTRSSDGTPSAVLDGSSNYFTRRDGKDLYVVPADATPALADGSLDPELFNVTGLLRQGYGDDDRDTLPLIVKGPAATTRALNGVSVDARLESVGASAVSATKSKLSTAYAQLTRNRSARTSIWLDAKVRATDSDLDPATGVEQTGAPQVWDTGVDGSGTKVAVLDTGYDADHPDLADQVVAAEDFTGAGVADSDGHGTHVASTIAGSGAADPSKVGMAPGADLLVGKVLGVGGGQASWIIAGMEWAVDNDADVVNMSLGTSEPTECDDPIAESAQNLAERSDSLFVVAAGNAGMRDTVSSPGCAEGVLTVGAVDDSGATADFSSRGSTLGDHRIKPDIAAPGVGIVGAAAGSPDGENYVAMSGTSMATPHVVGGAALVRQAHPDWSPQQVKDALTTSVKAKPQADVYEQGAGEMWVPGAVQTPVVTDSSVELASFDWPHDFGERASEKITYTNTTDRPLRLRLDVVDVRGADDRRVPAHAITVGRPLLKIPAGGSKQVAVTARGHLGELRDGAYGEISGRVIAKSLGGKRIRATTAVGYWLEPKTVNVTVRPIGRDGKPASIGYLDVTDMHQPLRQAFYLNGDDIDLRLRAGSYHIAAFIETRPEGGVRSMAYVGDPQKRFTKDTTYKLDARKATRVTVDTPRPSEIDAGSLNLTRTWDKWTVEGTAFAEAGKFFVSPTGRPKQGGFEFATALRAHQTGVPTEKSKYVYNLAFIENGRIGKDQSRVVRKRDVATVQEKWHSQRKTWDAEEWARVLPADGGQALFTSSGSPITTPTPRTSYFTTGLPWQQLASSGDYRLRPETWFDPVRTYRAGDRRKTEWFKLPTLGALHTNADGSPSRVAERQGNLVGFSFGPWQDTVSGRTAAGGFGDIGGLDVYENGELLRHSSWPSGQFRLSADDVEIRAEVSQRRISREQVWELGQRTNTSFTFRSTAPEGDEVVPLPVAMPRYDAPVDGRNLAPAAEEFPVSVTFNGQQDYDPGEIESFSAKVTFDEIAENDLDLSDQNWVDVPVVKRNGTWVALVDNTDHAGGVASLWIKAVDANDTRTEQYVLGLYGVE